MTAVEFFAAARAYKREATGEPLAGLTQEEVDALNAVVGKWKPAAVPVERGLRGAQEFFKSVRNTFGSLDQKQVDGFNAVLLAMGKAGWPLSWTAYGLATAWHETAHTMQPVEEAFWKDDDWRRRNLRYYPWHGRGYVQLTWERNYAQADEELNLGGRLVASAKLALDPAIAAAIMVKGMAAGWFTGKKLSDYLPRNGDANSRQFELARYIINGTDKAAAIADIAAKFQSALKAGGWA